MGDLNYLLIISMKHMSSTVMLEPFTNFVTVKTQFTAAAVVIVSGI